MSTFSGSIKRLLRQPSFLVAFVVLLFAAVGLNAATTFLKLHFKKLPVPIARPLDTVPMALGSWLCVTKDQLADDVQQELGTEHYIMRFYLDTNVVQKDDISAFETKDKKQREEFLGEIRKRYKGRLDRAIISVGVTYYTGRADTVAHIPERCYTADGYEPTATVTESWDLKTPQTPDGKVDVRYISFEDQAGTQRVSRNVAYFFHANGSYTSDPKVVRLKLQDLTAKYGYYSKIEVMIQGNYRDNDRDGARVAMQDFLTAALPEIEKCLPNWSALKQK